MIGISAHADAVGSSLFVADHPMIDDAEGLARDLVGAR
jgi:hypothetical protein